MQKKKSFKVVWAALLLLSAVLVPSGRALADATGSTVVGWGYNAYGQVGDGLNIPSDHYLPILVVGPGGPNGTGSLTGVKMIAPGAYHSLAVKTDGTVWSWGEGAYYNLGIGFSTVNYSVPQQVTDPSDATTFLQNVQTAAGGWWHNLALKNDGSVWGWGLDSVGQLGDGSTTNTGVPVQVLGPGGVGMLGGIKAISGGGAHTLALDSTGKVWAFGWNFYGQLGDGTNIDRHTPVQVTGLPVVKAIVAAYDFSLAWTSMAVFGPGGTTTSAR